jgi:DNA polymerase-3 subunit delta
MMKNAESQKSKKEEAFGPLILITGEEELLMADWLEKIKATVVDPSAADFNFNLFYGSAALVDEILTAVQTFPFLSDRRLVIVKEADLIPAKELEKLIPYINGPAPSTCLVFAAPKADMRKTFFIRLKEKGKVISCQRLYENQVGPWIRNRVKEAGIEIEENAAAYLKLEFGADLSKLSMEIEKLKAYAGGKKRISFEDCQVLSKGQRNCSVFDLVNETGSKNRSRALLLLASLLEEGQQPLVLLAMLLRHFRNLLKLGECKASGFSKGEISKSLGIPEFYLFDILKHSTLYPQKEIAAAFPLFLEADFQLKNNVRPPERVMEALILDLCEGKRLHSSEGIQNL